VQDDTYIEHAFGEPAVDRCEQMLDCGAIQRRTERMTHIEATSKSPECFRTFKKYNLDATFAHKM